MAASGLVGVESLRGYGKWLGLIVAVAALAAAATRLSGNTQDWPDAVMLLSNLGLVMGPIAIGVSAFAGGRAKRRGTFWAEDSTATGRLRASALECASLLLWTALAYLVVLLVCFVPTWIQATWSGPDLARVFASAGGILAQVVIGYYVGRLIPYALTAPFVAAASFSLVAVVDSAPNSQAAALFLPVNLDGFDFYDITRASASLVELAFYASVAIAVAAGWAVRTRPTRRTLLAAGFALVAVVGSSIGLATFHGQSNASAVQIAFSCEGRDPEICVHPATRNAEKQLRGLFAGVVEILAGTPFAITRVEQRPRGAGSTPSATAVGFGLDDRSTGALEEARQELAHNAISQRAACFNRVGAPLAGTSKDGPTLIAALGDRIAYGRTIARSAFSTDSALNSAITTITSTTDGSFRTLLTRDRQQIETCSLTRADVGRP